MGRIITIARGMGSGGKTIGKMLAKELDIPYYDKEIIRMASDESGINEKLFGRVDEKIKNTIFNREEIYDGELLEPDHKDFTSDRNLFNYTAKIITDIADSGKSAVIVGRCADFVLKGRKDVVKLFIYSDTETAIKNSVLKSYHNIVVFLEVFKHILVNARDIVRIDKRGSCACLFFD